MKKINFLFILTLFIMLFSTTCFASTISIPTSADNDRIKDTDHVIVVKLNDGTIKAYAVRPKGGSTVHDSNFGFVFTGSKIKINKPAFDYSWYSFVYKEGSWNNYGSGTILADGSNNYSVGNDITSEVLNSTYLVKDANGDIVFDPATLEEPEPPVEDAPDVPSVSYPVPPAMDYAFTYPVVYVAENGDVSLALFGSDTSINFDAIREEDKITVNFTTSSASKLSMYVLEDDEWDSRGHNVFSEAGTYTATLNMTSLLSSPFAIYNGDGTIFFLLPLENLGATITGAMWATTIVAVCCLALLIFLVVLSKILNRFLH